MIPLGTGRFWVPRESWGCLETMKFTQKKEVGPKNPSTRGLKTPMLDRERQILYPLLLPMILWLYHHRSRGGEGLNLQPTAAKSPFLLYKEFNLLKPRDAPLGFNRLKAKPLNFKACA